MTWSIGWCLVQPDLVIVAYDERLLVSDVVVKIRFSVQQMATFSTHWYLLAVQLVKMHLVPVRLEPVATSLADVASDASNASMATAYFVDGLTRVVDKPFSVSLSRGCRCLAVVCLHFYRDHSC